MCDICEMNKKLGIPNYLCIKGIYKSAKKAKSTRIIDMKPRIEVTITKMKTLDCEPKWVDMVSLLITLSKEPKNKQYVIDELTKIAKLADVIRSAQKKGHKITFDYRNGKDEITEED